MFKHNEATQEALQVPASNRQRVLTTHFDQWINKSINFYNSGAESQPAVNRSVDQRGENQLDPWPGSPDDVDIERAWWFHLIKTIDLFGVIIDERG